MVGEKSLLSLVFLRVSGGTQALQSYFSEMTLNLLQRRTLATSRDDFQMLLEN